MKHILPHPINENNRPKQHQSPSGGIITAYFETGQGSKYLLTDKGESKRWKSQHAEHDDWDKGLKEWFERCLFVDPKSKEDADAVKSFEKLAEDFDKVMLSKESEGKLVWYIPKGGTWKKATWEDRNPNYVKLNPQLKGRVISFEYKNEPEKGLMPVEIIKRPNGTVKKFHCGNEITKLLPISKAEPKDLLFFGIR